MHLFHIALTLSHGDLEVDRTFGAIIMQKRYIVGIFVFLVAMVALLIYLNSLPGPFFWDDNYLIKDNRHLESWAGAEKAVSSDVGSGANQLYGYYRPVQMFTYFTEHSMCGLEPVCYHVTNVVLHILVALCLFWMAALLFHDEMISFFASILYVTHPVHTEAVAYISGRTDPLAALFMLLAFIFYVKSLAGPIGMPFFIMIITYALALLSREQSLILLGLVLVYHYSFKKKVSLRNYMALIVMSVGYIVLRYAVLGLDITKTVKYANLIERVPGFFAAFFEYIRLIIMPVGLHMAYGHRTFFFTDLRVLLGIALFIAFILFIMRSARKDRVSLFSALWFMVALIPVTNIYPQLNAFMAAHWLYVPLIGMALLAANGLSALYKNDRTRVVAIMVLSAFVVFFSYLTIEQNNFWNNPSAFYEHTIKYAPDSYKWKLYYQLANERAKEGKLQEAITLYKKAVSLTSYFADAYNKLGSVYAETGDIPRAILSFKKALWVDPSYAPAYKNLADLYRRAGKPDLAAKYSSLAQKFQE